MTSFETKSKAVLDYVTARFPKEHPYFEADVTYSDIQHLLKKTMASPLYYCNFHSNDVEKSKYDVHTNFLDFLAETMTLIVGEFSFMFHTERTDKMEEGDKKEEENRKAQEKLYKMYMHTLPLQYNLKMHTMVKTEIDGYFYDHYYRPAEILMVYTHPSVYSQIALIRLAMRYTGFFQTLGVADQIFSAIKIILTTPLIYEVTFDNKIKESIETTFGWFISSEVMQKYKEEAKLYGNVPEKNRKFNFKLFQVVSNNPLPIDEKMPVVIVATDLQNAYDTYAKEFLEVKKDAKESIDSIVKISECLVFDEHIYEQVEDRILDKPIIFKKPKGPFEFLSEIPVIKLNDNDEKVQNFEKQR